MQPNFYLLQKKNKKKEEKKQGRVAEGTGIF